MRSKLRLVGAALAFAAGSPLAAFDPPTPASFRAEFEADFPKAEVNGPALELERLAASLGIDLAPKDTQNRVAVEAPKEDKDRPHPSAEAVEALQAVPVGSYLDRELKSAEEPIGALPVSLERYLAEHDAALASAQSLLLREVPQWEMDVTQHPGEQTSASRLFDSVPNLLGQIHLQRLLVVRALLEARRGETDGALQTLEASWRLNEALASRPEWICHLIVLAIAKMDVGALRKVDSPAYGWADRVRSRDLFLGYLAALQNEVWWRPGLEDLSGENGAFGRILRRVAEEFRSRDLCAWTPERLQSVWNDAARAECSADDAKGLEILGGSNFLEGLFRLRHFLVDSELTALLLDARAERAASRRHSWPAKMRNLDSEVCPHQRFSYRASENGTATVAFEGKLLDDSGGLHLPLTFTVGIPTPARRQTARQRIDLR